jgi:putative flippase GtrA
MSSAGHNRLLETIWKFACSGVANTLFGYSIIYGLMAVGLNPYASNAIGYVAGMVLAFILHRSWIFRSDVDVFHIFPKYASAVLLSYIANLAVLRSAIDIGLTAWIGQLLGGLAYTSILYVLSLLWVFKARTSS